MADVKIVLNVNHSIINDLFFIYLPLNTFFSLKMDVAYNYPKYWITEDGYST